MLYSKSAQLTLFIIVLTQTWDPVAVTRCVCVCGVYLERCCINKPALACRNLFLEASVNGLCFKRINRVSCFFSLIWFPCLAQLRHHVRLAEFTAVTLNASSDFNICTVTMRWHTPRLLYNITFLSRCLPVELWFYSEGILLESRPEP